jgi:hypothetical protein
MLNIEILGSGSSSIPTYRSQQHFTSYVCQAALKVDGWLKSPRALTDATLISSPLELRTRRLLGILCGWPSQKNMMIHIRYISKAWRCHNMVARWVAISNARGGAVPE